MEARSNGAFHVAGSPKLMLDWTLETDYVRKGFQGRPNANSMIIKKSPLIIDDPMPHLPHHLVPILMDMCSVWHKLSNCQAKDRRRELATLSIAVVADFGKKGTTGSLSGSRNPKDLSPTESKKSLHSGC
jgi:hypothetical protein